MARHGQSGFLSEQILNFFKDNPNPDGYSLTDICEKFPNKKNYCRYILKTMTDRGTLSERDVGVRGFGNKIIYKYFLNNQKGVASDHMNNIISPSIFITHSKKEEELLKSDPISLTNDPSWKNFVKNRRFHYINGEG